jgi:hypothetical protein
MLVKIQLPPQKKEEIELLNEFSFTSEVISFNEGLIYTGWSVNPKGFLELSSSNELPNFISLMLVKKNRENVFKLKVRWELYGICSQVTLDVSSVKEVFDFPQIQPICNVNKRRPWFSRLFVSNR